MKKLLKASIIIALALLAISCDGNTSEAESVALSSINASIDNAASRTVTNEDGGLSFAAGDAIGVYMDSNEDIPYVYNGSGAFTPESTVIYFEDTGEHTITAYYPYNTSTSIDTTQSEVTDILYASTTGNYKDGASFTGTGAFRHALSKLTITFQAGNGVTEDNLKTKGLTYTISGIATSGTFDKSAGTISNTESTGNVSASIATGSTSLASSLLLLPQTVTDIPISVSYNGQIYNGTLNITELKAGTNHNFTVTVSNTGLTINSGITITGWTDGGSSTSTVTLSAGTGT